MKRLVALVSLLPVAVLGLAPAGAGPTAGGFTSDNVEWVKFIRSRWARRPALR